MGMQQVPTGYYEKKNMMQSISENRMPTGQVFRPVTKHAHTLKIWAEVFP
jgi:hypothetical protein